MKGIAISILLWAGCLFVLGFLARVTWIIFMIGWSIL